MKKITLNQLNLSVVDGQFTPNVGCDFCGDHEATQRKLIVASRDFRYRDENKRDNIFTPTICFDCVRQLSKLIDDEK